MTEKQLTDILETARADYDLPAVGASVIIGGRNLTAVVGHRKAGDPTRATRNDKFHLGSCTKAMTATMIAISVEQGKLHWDTTLESIFPHLKMHPACKAITVFQLLTHQGGMPPPERSYPAGVDWQTLSGSPREHRRQYLERVLNQPPDFSPGTRAQYSNAGYVVLGAVLEQCYDEEWEQLARRLLFTPLGMTTAGFGPMASPDKVDQPWQHRVMGERKIPIGSGISSGIPPDNAPVLGPAGRVHCSLQDWAKFVMIFLPDSPHVRRLLKPATIAKMLTPTGKEGFGMGWLITERRWAGGQAITHAGSNTMSFAVVWGAPKKNFAVMVATNQGDSQAEKASDYVAGRVVQEFLTSQSNQ